MIARTLCFIIKRYQYTKNFLGLSVCRFYPSCSEYALLAITKYGAFKGSVKAAGRILRCSPLSRGGHDPLN